MGIKNIIRKITRNSSKQNVKADYIQVSYFNFSEGAIPMWGPRRYRETTPKQKRLNEKKAKRYFEALVEANFKGNRDFVAHPTFSDDKYPESEEVARKVVKNWIGRINYRRRKLGMENCKYIIVYNDRFQKYKKIIYYPEDQVTDPRNAPIARGIEAN